MKKIIASVLMIGMVMLFSVPVSASNNFHTHMMSHYFTGSTYQVQIRTESRVYAVLADGTVITRPYVIYGIYKNCEQRCGCGYTFKCPEKHLERTVGGWAY